MQIWRRTGMVVAAVAFAAAAPAQSARGRAEATVGGVAVSIDYGRPNLKGRDMMGKAPDGFVWRLGANQATVIESTGELVFGETAVPKGSYSLFARRVDRQGWELIFNEQTGQWGTQHDASKDLYTVPLQWRQQDESTEQFTIQLGTEGDVGALTMTWGSHVLTTEFQTR